MPLREAHVDEALHQLVRRRRVRLHDHRGALEDSRIEIAHGLARNDDEVRPIEPETDAEAIVVGEDARDPAAKVPDAEEASERLVRRGTDLLGELVTDHAERGAAAVLVLGEGTTTSDAHSESVEEPGIGGDDARRRTRARLCRHFFLSEAAEHREAGDVREIAEEAIAIRER